jgi:hypothetical protein
MPVRKFHDVSEMPGPSRIDPKAPGLWNRIAGWLALSARLARQRGLPPPGVHKNRTVEEAAHRRESWQMRSRGAR